MTGHSDSNNDDSDEVTSPRTDDPNRRTRLVLGVLFHLAINRQRNTRASPERNELEQIETHETRSIPVVPDHPLRILCHDDPVASVATCRFCLEGMIPSSSNDDDSDTTSTPINQYISGNDRIHQLVAPCNCLGGSEWVHMQCLRRWQRQALSMNDRRMAEQCNVCTALYLLPPPTPPRLRSHLIKRGSYLVATDACVSGTTFHQKVVLLLHDLEVGGTMSGVIINSDLPVRFQVNPSFDFPDNLELLWRAGGPVCGGRFGLVRYIVAHNLTGTDSETEQHSNDPQVVSRPIFGDTTVEDRTYSHQSTSSSSNIESGGDDNSDVAGHLQFLAEAFDGQAPQTYRPAELSDAIQRLVQSSSNTGSTSSTSFPRQRQGKVVVFGGYCQWGRGQLQSELQREVWKVWPFGGMHDLFGHEDCDLWDEVTSDDRIMSSPELLEEQDEDIALLAN